MDLHSPGNGVKRETRAKRKAPKSKNKPTGSITKIIYIY